MTLTGMPNSAETHFGSFILYHGGIELAVLDTL